MEISKDYAEKIQNHVTGLLGKDVSFINTENKYLTSSYVENIGRKANLPLKVFSSTRPVTFENRGEQQIAIPLFVNNEILGVLLVSDDDEKGLEQAKIIKSFAELLVDQYIQKVQAIKDSTDQFVARILYNKELKNMPQLISEASILGHKLNIPRIAIMIKLEGFWEDCLLNDQRFDGNKIRIIDYWKKEIDEAISGFFTKASDNIIAYLGEDLFIIFKDVSQSGEEKAVELFTKNFSEIFSSLKNHQIKNITIGISRAYSGIKGLVKSHKEAKLSALLGEKIYGPEKSYYIEDLGVISIIGEGNRDKKLNFASELLGNLTNHDLLKTLECFFNENLNLTSTAQKLHIHRNTVIYRLDQISRIIGLDPRNFDDAVSIKIALLVRQLFL